MNKSVVRVSILALGGMLAVALPALADEVVYTTTGVFSENGTNVFTGATNNNKTAFVTFNSYSGDDFLPAADSLGTLSVSAPAGTQIVGSGNFLLSIGQSVDGGATETGDLGNAGFSGTLKANGNGGLTLTFAQTQVTIGQITYTLEDLGGPGGNVLTFGKGGAIINASITTPLPEPSFFALTGIGFLGLAFVAVRRYKQNNAPTV
jgi:hypothetical protein